MFSLSSTNKKHWPYKTQCCHPVLYTEHLLYLQNNYRTIQSNYRTICMYYRWLCIYKTITEPLDGSTENPTKTLQNLQKYNVQRYVRFNSSDLTMGKLFSGFIFHDKFCCYFSSGDLWGKFCLMIFFDFF